ncbi:Long-chain-fatty-acid--CoA ligase [bacterium HR19]|nr:Long-chain-fatty-acid--CoA ligase [bacterium HR19]
METVVELLEDKAKRYPQNKIEVYGVETMTFQEWNSKSTKLANILYYDFGVRKGDRVAIMFSNKDAVFFKISYFGVVKCGALPVPVNIRLPAEGIKFVLENSEAKGIIFGDEFSENIQKLKKEVKLGFYISRSQAENALSNKKDGNPPPVEIKGSDHLDIIYTSGTTGFPKGVISTHRSLFVRDDSIYESMYAGRTFLHAVPLFTFAGCHAMMLIPLRYALNAVILPKFDAKHFLEVMKRKGIVMVYAVPFHLLSVMREEEFEKSDLEHIKLIMFGTAPMPPWAVKKLAEKLPSTWIMNLYGATEAGMAGCFLPPGMASQKPDSIGIPLPPTEVKICDDDGNEVPRGQKGEIWMRIPGVDPRKYFKDEESSKKVWTEDGWVKTGDIGYMDEDGYLYVVDRKKDIIIRGGFNISSAKVEGVIMSHPDVVESAVVGVPHPLLGEDVFAFVVAKRKISEQELINFLKDKLADNEIPRYYEFVDELPKNATGKVLKYELRERAKKIYEERRRKEGKEV